MGARSEPVANLSSSRFSASSKACTAYIGWREVQAKMIQEGMIKCSDNCKNAIATVSTEHKQHMHLPKMLHSGRGGLEPVVVMRNAFEGLEVQDWVPTHQKLKLGRPEHFKRFAAAHPVKAFTKALELLGNALHQHPLHVLVNVVAYIGVRDGHIATVGHQVESLHFAVDLEAPLEDSAKGGLNVAVKVAHFSEVRRELRIEL